MFKIVISSFFILLSLNTFAQQHNWVQITGGREEQTYPSNDFGIEGGFYVGENFYARGSYIDSRETNGGSDNNALYLKHKLVEAGVTLPINEAMNVELGLLHQKSDNKNVEKGGVRPVGTYDDSSITGTGYGLRLVFNGTNDLSGSVGYARTNYPTVSNDSLQLEVRKLITKNIYGLAGYTYVGRTDFHMYTWKLGVGYRFD